MVIPIESTLLPWFVRLVHSIEIIVAFDAQLLQIRNEHKAFLTSLLSSINLLSFVMTTIKYKYVHYMTLYNEAARVRSLRSRSRIVYWRGSLQEVVTKQELLMKNVILYCISTRLYCNIYSHNNQLQNQEGKNKTKNKISFQKIFL